MLSNLRTLTNQELQLEAERDPRFNVDPMFTELALRVWLTDHSTRYERFAKPALIDARKGGRTDVR
jgi:hypothetical protein